MKKYYNLMSCNTDTITKDWELAVKEKNCLENAVHAVSIVSAIMTAIFAFLPKDFSTKLSGHILFVQILDLIFLIFLGLFISNLIKKVVYAERKIVILRSNLGLTFHELGTVLPRDRIEGAVYHSDIKMFSGFIHGDNLIFSFILVLNSIAMFLFIFMVNQEYSATNVAAAISMVLIPMILYRIRLLDDHENVYLYLIRFLSKIFFFKFIKDIEYAFYQAQLNAFETKSFLMKNGNNEKSLLSDAAKVAVLIEDNTFYRNAGINIYGFIRALIVHLPLFGKLIAQKKRLSRCSGGSSITQQVVRTLFFVQNHPLFTSPWYASIFKHTIKIRKKIFEILLARFWASKVFSKEEIMELYLCSVRYAPNISRIKDAIDFYHLPYTLNAYHWFFLIERLAWVTPKFNRIRVELLAKKCNMDNQLTREIMPIYLDNIDKFDEESKIEIRRIIQGHELKIQTLR